MGDPLFAPPGSPRRPAMGFEPGGREDLLARARTHEQVAESLAGNAFRLDPVESLPAQGHCAGSCGNTGSRPCSCAGWLRASRAGSCRVRRAERRLQDQSARSFTAAMFRRVTVRRFGDSSITPPRSRRGHLAPKRYAVLTHRAAAAEMPNGQIVLCWSRGGRTDATPELAETGDDRRRFQCLDQLGADDGVSPATPFTARRTGRPRRLRP